MKRVAFLLVLGLPTLAVPAGSASAQQTARVTVRVESAGVAVDGAEVRAGTLTSLTGEDGNIVLTLPFGTHLLEVQRLGYLPASLRLSVQSDTLVIVTLEAQAAEADEIVVASTRRDRRIEDEPVRVEVLTGEEIEEKLLMTPGSLVMLLNETTGLRVQETSPALGGAGIRIQGLRGRYTQLLADGLPLYGGQAGALGLLQIPPMDLRQVEVIKGAASALYGGSALGGVVNLISKRPANEREILVNATTRAGGDALLWLAGDHDRWGYTLLGGAHTQRRTDVDDDAWIDIASHSRFTARPRIFWYGPRGNGMVTAGFMTEDRRGGGRVPGGASFAQNLETTRADAGMTGRGLLGDAMLLDWRASAATTAHDHRFGALRERDRHTTFFGEASLRGEAGRHHWAAGLALQRDGYGARDISGFDYAWWTPGIFAQDELRVGGGVTLAGSARLDRHSEYGTFLSPRVSLLAKPAETIALRVSAGTGFFAPTPFTEETEDVGLSRVEPLTGLEAERARSASADLGVTLRGVEINLTLFASDIEAAVAVESALGASLARLINLDGTTRTRGTELLVRYRREPWGITVSHTYLDATEPAPDGNRRQRVPLTPRHMAGLVAVHEREGEGRAGLELYFTGKQSLDGNPYRTSSAPYVIVGVLLEKRFGRVRAFLNLENLTDTRQTRHHPVVLPAPGLFGRRTTDSWAPLEGRVFNGGVRVRL
ncbi:MAG: TonB-dependent receptor [Gemmatimonadetes bacterium]|nr:TonB-dependent receptor [Gemmatimonadota bacterium]